MAGRLGRRPITVWPGLPPNLAKAMPQKVRIIGVPMDLGQSRRGVDMAPSALRGAGLQSSIKKLGLQVEDIGNLSVKQPEEMPVGEKRAKHLQETAETCSDFAAATQKPV